jgi:hypothetical protein
LPGILSHGLLVGKHFFVSLDYEDVFGLEEKQFHLP